MFNSSTTPARNPVVLTIGGLDPSGGAGILLDAAAIRSLGAHPAAVATVMTIQDGGQFKSASVRDPDEVIQSVELMLGNSNLVAIKVGALGSARLVELLAKTFSTRFVPPVVLDPVLATTTGGALLDEEGVEMLKTQLLRRVALLTPNVPEAERLTGMKITNRDEAALAAKQLVSQGAQGVLVKGGHLAGPTCVDILYGDDGWTVFEDERLEVGKVRGTGCALSSLIATQLGARKTLKSAVGTAREILMQAMRSPINVGYGPPVLGEPIASVGVDPRGPGL